MHKRNRHLVDNSSVCVCYLAKDSGGTDYTVGYARLKGLKVINLASGRTGLWLALIWQKIGRRASVKRELLMIDGNTSNQSTLSQILQQHPLRLRFWLGIHKVFQVKLPCLAKKFLAVGHILNFQTALRLKKRNSSVSKVLRRFGSHSFPLIAYRSENSVKFQIRTWKLLLLYKMEAWPMIFDFFNSNMI